MSEIMRCVFERREPVRNVTALALMQYACEEFPRSRVDVVGMDNFMDKPSMGDDDILWSVEEREDDVVFTLVDRGSLTPDGVRAFVYKASSGFVRREGTFRQGIMSRSRCRICSPSVMPAPLPFRLPVPGGGCMHSISWSGCRRRRRWHPSISDCRAANGIWSSPICSNIRARSGSSSR